MPVPGLLGPCGCGSRAIELRRRMPMGFYHRVEMGLLRPRRSAKRANSEGVNAALVGRVAKVTTAVPGGDKPGEAILRVRGGTEAYLVYCDEPIDRGKQVVVVEDRGSRRLFVARLDE